MTKIPVNSIEIPCEYVDICGDWHGGQYCLLYAVSSTGNLTTGTIRPYGVDADGNSYPMSDEQWYLSLWRDLSNDVYCAVRTAEKAAHRDDADWEDEHDKIVLAAFETWIDEEIIPELEASYDLADWCRDVS